MAFKEIDEVGLVAKVDVGDLNVAFDWYRDMLDLVPQPQFFNPIYRQLRLPGARRSAIGLNYNPSSVGTGGATITFVVDDINRAREVLINRGVSVGEVTPAGRGAQLAFFEDQDGNQLALRQNPAPVRSMAE